LRKEQKAFSQPQLARRQGPPRPKIFEMWMACFTQEEIAVAANCKRDVVQAQSEKFVETVLQNQNRKADADHATDFAPPIYNIWKWQEKTAYETGELATFPARFKRNLGENSTQGLQPVVNTPGRRALADLHRAQLRQ
jgi:hypothetical protein